MYEVDSIIYELNSGKITKSEAEQYIESYIDSRIDLSSKFFRDLKDKLNKNGLKIDLYD